MWPMLWNDLVNEMQDRSKMTLLIKWFQSSINSTYYTCYPVCN